VECAGLQFVDGVAGISPLYLRERGGGEGKRFTDEQRWRLERADEHIPSNLGLEAEDFGCAPFDQCGGPGKVHQLFGKALLKIIASLTYALAA